MAAASRELLLAAALAAASLADDLAFNSPGQDHHGGVLDSEELGLSGSMQCIVVIDAPRQHNRGPHIYLISDHSARR